MSKLSHLITFLRIFILTVLICFTLYCSWIPKPHMKNITIIPNWLANWADSPENMDLRTIVPFILLGTILPITKNGISSKRYLTQLIILVLILLIAELGQLHLPKRHFSWDDIFFGIDGIFLGFALSLVLKITIIHVKLKIQRA